MNKNKQFEKMSNEELCAIAAKLKFQLVEARFKMSSGEIEKISVIKEIRKTIAKIFTELTNRGFKVSIGAHGIAMYDINNNMKPIALDSKKIADLMKKDDDKKAKAEKPVEAKVEEKPVAKKTTKARKSTIKEKKVEDKGEKK